MSVVDFKYDVAISLRAVDAPLAEQLRDALQPLNVFVFTQRQREIAGKNLVETFTEVFKRDARLAVILYRKGWGETEYTDLESLAIQSRGLKTRWRSPVLVALDDTPVPLWFPDVYGYLEYTRYGFEETVGVIRARAEELGSIDRPESPAERAVRIERARLAQVAREDHVLSVVAMREVAEEVQRLFSILETHAVEIRESAPTIGLTTGADSTTYGVRSGRTSTNVLWRQEANSRQSARVRGAPLRVLRATAMWPIPGRDRGTVADSSVKVSRECFDPVYTADGWMWQETRAYDLRPNHVFTGNPDGELLSTEQLAERVLRDHMEYTPND